MSYDLSKWENKLVVFEGADKTGKTSVAHLLSDYLNKNGIETVFTFQPGDTNWGPLAQFFRSLCKDKRWNLHTLSNFFAFQLDRVEQTDKVVVPALEQGKTVISDRWNYSTYAYQLYGKQLIKEYNIPEEVLTWLLDAAITSRNPDFVIYFRDTLDVERDDDLNDSFDRAGHEFFKRVKDAYDRLYDRNTNWLLASPGNNAEETLENVLEMVDKTELGGLR